MLCLMYYLLNILINNEINLYMNEQVLKNIRAIRMSRGFSQEYLAEQLGIDYTSYGRIELGKTALTMDRLFKIADILAVSINSLIAEPQASGDFNTFLSNPNDWLKKAKDYEQTADQAAKCREELSAAQKKIIELQARLLEVFDKK